MAHRILLRSDGSGKFLISRYRKAYTRMKVPLINGNHFIIITKPILKEILSIAVFAGKQLHNYCHNRSVPVIAPTENADEEARMGTKSKSADTLRNR